MSLSFTIFTNAGPREIHIFVLAIPPPPTSPSSLLKMHKERDLIFLSCRNCAHVLNVRRSTEQISLPGAWKRTFAKLVFASSIGGGICMIQWNRKWCTAISYRRPNDLCMRTCCGFVPNTNAKFQKKQLDPGKSTHNLLGLHCFLISVH